MGYEREKVTAAYPDYLHAVQEPQRGTGHAVQCAREALAGFAGSVLVCYGDMPLLRRETYESLIATHRKEGNDCTLLSAVSDEELPYGRIVRRADGAFSHIVEDKDCTPEEKAIRELNVGVYVFEAGPLWEAIDQLQPNNAQGEYYLTDAPSYILSRGGKVGACPTCTPEEMRPTSCPGAERWGPAPPAPRRRCWGSTRWSSSTRWRTSSAEGRGGHESLSQRRH